MNKIVHITVVTYKHGFLLKTFIDSLRAQTFQNFILYIYNDGKDEEMYDNLVRCSYLTPNIHFVQTEQRMNQYGHNLRDLSLKKLIEENKTTKDDLYLLSNGDNYYTPNFLELMVEPFVKNSQTGVSYCHMVHSHNRDDATPRGKYGYLACRFEPCQVDIGAFLIRGDIIAKLGGFPYRDFNGDAHWIEDINNLKIINSLDKEKAFTIEEVKHVLFIHN